CLGRYGDAIAQLTEAIEVCERIGDRVWRSRLQNTLGWCLAEIGSPRRARELNEQAAVLANEPGDPEIVGNSEINLAANHFAVGDVDGAHRYLDPIVEALSRPGDPWMRWRYSLHATHLQGRLALAAGDLDRALAHARAEADGARRHRAPKIAARALILSGQGHLPAHQHGAARRSRAQATRIAADVRHPP